MQADVVYRPTRPRRPRRVAGLARGLPREVTGGTGRSRAWKPSSPEVIAMQYMELMPIAVSAWRYSLAYLICGGGVFGAIIVFVGAKMLGK